jgi:nicotinate phosphoribosyltransferase
MFFTAKEEEIKAGRVTDIYFERAKRILEAKGIDKRVKMEARLKKFPKGWEWGILCGLSEAIELLGGFNFNVWALPEGTIFKAGEPVFLIECSYREFAPYETALLGFLCQASGIATRAARCVIAAEGRPVMSFGIRRLHPAIAPMVDRAAYIGGCEGVSGVLGAELIGEEPVGTIPHALILILEDSTTATIMFDEVIEPNVKRVALVDTFGDEKFEALENANLLGDDLYAVRLDTPSSRRGDMLEIAREVRWELDMHGHEKVKIFASGGLDEETIPKLNEVIDAYGVGTAISNAPVLDFALDIVEIEGEPIAKRGKLSGAKQLYTCECGWRCVVPWNKKLRECPQCNREIEPRLVQFLKDGKLTKTLPSPRKIREYVLGQLKLIHRISPEKHP